MIWYVGARTFFWRTVLRSNVIVHKAIDAKKVAKLQAHELRIQELGWTTRWGQGRLAIFCETRVWPANQSQAALWISNSKRTLS